MASERTETLAGPSGPVPQEVRLFREHAGHLPVDMDDEASITRFPRGALLLAGTHQIIKEILTELSRDLELKSSEVTTKPMRYLGRTLVKTKGTTLELMLRTWTACWRSSTCPRSTAHQQCTGNAVRKMRKRCLQANEESTDSLLDNCCGFTELTCAVRCERPHQALDVRATRT